MADSPTSRTLRELRKRGYRAEVTEKWNPHAFIRQDLFGIVDVLALGDRVGAVVPAETLAVQACAGDSAAARIKKVQAADALPWLLAAGWHVEVWAWRKSMPSRRYVLRRVRILSALRADAVGPG